MKVFPAKYAKNRFGHLIDSALEEPVVVTKNDRPSVVVMSVNEFKRLKENDLWDEVNKGFEQIENGEGIEYDFNEILRKANKEHDKYRQRK